jgi:hypothetical protein
MRPHRVAFARFDNSVRAGFFTAGTTVKTLIGRRGLFASWTPATYKFLGKPRDVRAWPNCAPKVHSLL